MVKKQAVIYQKLLTVIIIIALIILLFARAFDSVELTDEVHGIASIYNIYLGKVPFMTSWDYHTGWCLLVPLFALYHKLVPSLSGVVLYFRVIYLLFTGLNAVIIASLLRDRNNREGGHVGLYVFPILFFVPFSIFQINYNTFVIQVLSLISVMLFTSQKSGTETIRYFIIGVLMCLNCITYPTFIVAAILLAIWIVFENRSYNWKSKACWYIFGGMMPAVIFIIWIFSKGSFQMFQEALNGMFSSPHEQTKGAINFEFLLQTFYYPIKTYFLRVFSILIFGYVVAVNMFTKKMSKKAAVTASVLFFILYLLLNIWFNREILGYAEFGILIGVILTVLLLKPSLFKKYAVFFMMLLLFVLTYSFTSDNKNIFLSFENAGPFIALLVGIVLSANLPELNSAFLGFISVALAVSGLSNTYAYIYGDAPIEQLTEQVEYGVYKGLYTTSERKIFVEKLERELKRIPKNKTVCTVTRAPMVYVMSQAQICAPQTWDAQFLMRGYTSSKPLMDYFKAINQTPDILVATSLDVNDFYENSKYEINTFIESYYTLYYTNQICGVDIYLWKKDK